MQITEVKNIISNKNYDGQFFIFQYADNKFVAQQYARKIINDFQFELIYKDEIDNSIKTFSSIFGESNNNYLRVFDIDELNTLNYDIASEKNLIIICKKISDQIKSIYEDNIVIIPKLEDWQIKDFVYSIGDGINESDLDKLIDLCDNNIYRLSMELDKMIIFPLSIRKNIFNEFNIDGVFNDLSDATIFDFCSAILKKDINKLTQIYIQLDRIDVNPLGFISILYQNIKDLIKIQTISNATPENTKIAKNKFYAIKYNNLNKFSSYQLIQIFKLLSSIDKKIKLGQLDINDLLDYIVVSIFSF